MSTQDNAVSVAQNTPIVRTSVHNEDKKKRSRRPHVGSMQTVTSKEKVTTAKEKTEFVWHVRFTLGKMHFRTIPVKNVPDVTSFTFPLAKVGELDNTQRVFLLRELPKLGVTILASEKSIITTTLAFADQTLSHRKQRRIVDNVNNWLLLQGYPKLAILMTRKTTGAIALQLCQVCK